MKSKITILGEQPVDAKRIIRDFQSIVNADRMCGKIGRYFYFLKIENGKDVLHVEITTKKKGEISRNFRSFPIMLETNRTWKQITTPLGKTIFVLA